MIKCIRQEYESIFEDGSGKMSVNRLKVNEYLGMTLYYNVHGQVRIMMLSYIEEIITDFDKAYPKGKVTKSSAAPNNIFVENEYYKKMDQEKVVEFHDIVAKNCYATKRPKPDTCTAISFLTRRVWAPGEEDWSKLVHLMQYLRGTSKLSLTLIANVSGILKCWFDALFAVHTNIQ